MRFFLSVSFSRFSAVSLAVCRANQLVYLITLRKKSQHLFSDFLPAVEDKSTVKEKRQIKLKSLILAQDERWRRA